MNLERVVFGFVIILALTFNFVFVMGDIDNWNYDLLNKLFNMIMNGSQLIALHKGRYWEIKRGLAETPKMVEEAG